MAESKERLNVLDLFAGAGGFTIGLDKPEWLTDLGGLEYDSLGYESVEFNTVAAVEKDKEAAKTFKKNFPNTEVLQTDITEIDSFSKWKSTVDVIVGGPPCQGFSKLNSIKTEELDDERNNLWQEYLRAVKDVNPDFFIIENVDRFVSSGHADAAVEMAEELGYSVSVKILDSDDFGVPQMRTRAFIFGSKLGTVDIPESNDEATRTVADAIKDLEDDPDESNVSWHNSRRRHEITRKRLEKISVPGGDRRDLEPYPELIPDCWKNIGPNQFSDGLGRLWNDRPAVTITTGFYQPMKGRHVHPYENRAITIREGARFQTFPDSFTYASNAKGDVARQIGNAVPPKWAYELGRILEQHFEENT